MSDRTKFIMDLVVQQASHSRIDIVEYVVGEAGTLTPIYTHPCNSINETLLNNNIEASLTNSLASFDQLELPVDLNDDVSMDNDIISTSFVHSNLPTDVNDTIGMNTVLENPQILKANQDKDNNNSTITNISSEHDDLDISYVPEENHSDSNSDTNDNNDEEKNESDISLISTKTRRKRKVSEEWNYNVNKYKRLKGQPYKGRKKIAGAWDYNINKPGTVLFFLKIHK